MGCSNSTETAKPPKGTTPSKGPGRNLYFNNGSPPSRAVLMCAKALGLDVNVVHVDIIGGEHKKDWYTKINPNQVVPTLEDGGSLLYESRAVLQYLMNQYGPGNSMYPSDPQKRAVVERWLWYDQGNLFKAVPPFFLPVALRGEEPDSEKEAEVAKCFDYIDKELESRKYLTGDDVTIADFSIIQMIIQLDIIDYDTSKWSNLTSYKARMKELPYYEESSKGVDVAKQLLKERNAKQGEE